MKTTDQALARTTDPATSHQAAATVKVSRDKQRVLGIFLTTDRPMSDAEMYDRAYVLGYNTRSSSLRFRRKQLADMGWLEATHKAPVKGHGTAERLHWQLTPEGHKFAQQQVEAGDNE